jgi:hypothetical protein
VSHRPSGIGFESNFERGPKRVVIFVGVAFQTSAF